MMEQKQWEDGIKAWEKIKKQAMIDIEQAELYIEAIQKQIKKMESK